LTGKSDPEDQSFLSSLASVAYSQLTVTDVLELVVGLATQTLDDLIGASVSVHIQPGGRFETPTASSPVVRELDELQYGGRGGPCVDAILTGSEVRALISGVRYPEFEAAAAQAGVASVRSLPLLVEGNAVGALNLYSAKAPGLGQPDSSPAEGLASYAAIVLSNAMAWDKVQDANSRLTRALASRGVIGQAQGILIAREHIGPDEAFDILRRASQRMNRKLRDVAAELVDQASTHPPREPDPDANR
jgi:GAF domain-containing protein